MRLIQRSGLFISLLGILLSGASANAHVKWFSDHRLDQAPASFASLSHPSFWGLLILSVVTISYFVYADRALDTLNSYARFNRFLESYANRASIILRIFTGASLLLAWQVDSMIAPELKASAGVGWFQFALAVGLLLRTTAPVSGTGMIGLYLYAVTQYGFFHMLDYMIYPAIGFFLLVSASENRSIFSSRIPALYIGLGFSLCWAALEKVFFPGWGLEVLHQKPALTMGLPPDFFLLSCAFVELSLGYLLMIGLLQRPLAVIITLTFFTTSAFFGKTEVVGHTILHGALLVFIVAGPGGYYPTPIQFHKRLWLRSLFAGVNFVIVVTALAVPYWFLAQRAYKNANHHDEVGMVTENSRP